MRKGVLTRVNRWLGKGADSRNPPKKIKQIREIKARGPSSWDEPLVSEKEVGRRSRILEEHQAPINAQIAEIDKDIASIGQEMRCARVGVLYNGRSPRSERELQKMMISLAKKKEALGLERWELPWPEN